MPRKAHFWQVDLLEVVLSEYLDKSHNFTNLIFMILSLQDSVGPGCLNPTFPLLCRFSAMRRCQCQCQCRDQFLFAPSIPVAARTIVLITNPLTACFFFLLQFFFCHYLLFDFRGIGGESRPVLDIYCTKCQTLFFMHTQEIKQHINILFYLKICLKPQRSNFIP